jgi:hypothetical protein
MSLDEIGKERDNIDSIVQSNALPEVSQIWTSLFSSSLNNYNEALNHLSQISDSSKYSYLVWFLKGNLHFVMGKQEENEQLSNQLVLNNNTPINENYYLQALQEYSVSITKNIKFSLGYYNRAYVKGALHDFSGAILDYSVAIFYDNSFAEAYYNRGVLYLFLGNKEKGCNDISKAGELGIKESYNVLYKYCNQ